MDVLPPELMLTIVKFVPDRTSLMSVCKMINDVTLITVINIVSEKTMINVVLNEDILSLSRYCGRRWINKALSIAAHNGLQNVINILIKSESHLNIQFALHKACCGQQIEILKFLMDRFLDDAKWFLKDGLSSAVEGGSIECINYLMHLGANNWDNIEYNAYKNGNKEIIRLAVVHGGDRDPQWLPNAILGSFAGGHYDRGYKLLMVHPNNWNSILIGASISGSVYWVKSAIDKGATNRTAALCMAASHERRAIIKYLVPLIQDAWCLNNALSTACNNEHDGICELLIALGATHCDVCNNKNHKY